MIYVFKSIFFLHNLLWIVFYAQEEFHANENGDDEVTGPSLDLDNGSESWRDVSSTKDDANGTGSTERTFQILREPGRGLGMSISGGIGTTPYVGNDPVPLELSCNKLFTCVFSTKCILLWFYSVIFFSYFCRLQGIFVSHVAENSPASESGVRVGDKLIKVSEIDSVVFVGGGISGNGGNFWRPTTGPLYTHEGESFMLSNENSVPPLVWFSNTILEIWCNLLYLKYLLYSLKYLTKSKVFLTISPWQSVQPISYKTEIPDLRGKMVNLSPVNSSIWVTDVIIIDLLALCFVMLRISLAH